MAYTVGHLCLSMFVMFQVLVERDLRTRVRCNARVQDVRKIRNACGTPGPASRDFSPGRKMSTAGLSYLVVKEACAREFVRIASMS